MDISQTRKKLMISNIIIASLCLIVILCYFLLPFWKVSISLTLNSETMETILDEELGDEDITVQNNGVSPTSTVIYANTPTIENEINKNEISFEDLDFGKMLGDEEVTIEAGISLGGTHIVGSLINDPEETVADVLKSNLDHIVDQLDETLSKIAKNAAKQVSAIVLKEQVKSEIRSLYDTEKTDEELQAMLNKAGITDSYIEQKTDKIVNSLYEKNANVETVSNTIVNTVEEICNKLKTSDDEDFENLVLTDEDKADIKAETKEILQEIAQKDGSINGDEIVSRLILSMLEEDEGVRPSSSIYGKQNIQPLASNQQVSEDDVKEQLKEKLYEMLEVPEETVEIISIVLRVLAGLLLITILSWLYSILKILFQLKAPNNGVKLKCPMILGWWPFLILFLIPTVAFAFLTNPSSPIADVVGAETMEMFSYLSIDFFSSSIIAFIVAFGLFLFSVIYYRKLRKSLAKAIANPEQPIVAETSFAAIPTQSETDAIDNVTWNTDDDTITESIDETLNDYEEIEE